MTTEEEEAAPLGVGDRILVMGGVRDGTRGRIYYFDTELLRILPDGVTDRLVDLPIVDGDFDPALGIEALYPLSRRATPSFVEQINAYKGQKAETYSATGEPGLIYTIAEVDPKADTITLVDTTGARKDIEFVYGIPREEPFAVLRPQPPPAEVELGRPEPEGDEAEDAFADIEEAPEVEMGGLYEISETMVSYPDTIQRNEMIDDLLSGLPIASQRNPKQLQRIRKEVEQCILLRNDVTLYSKSGDPYGQKPTSFQTVMEMIQKTDIPLARPVLDAKRTIMTRDTDPAMGAFQQLAPIFQGPSQLAASNFLERQLGATAQTTPDALPAWYLTWEAFFKRFMNTFISEGAPGETVIFAGDKEFLRAPVPMMKEDDSGELELRVDGLKYVDWDRVMKRYKGDTKEWKAKRKEQRKEEKRKQKEAAKAAKAAGEAEDTEALEEAAEAVEQEGQAEQPTRAFYEREDADNIDKVIGEAIAEEQTDDLVASKRKRQMLIAPGKIGHSLMKGLGPRVTRIKAKEAPRRIETGDEGVIVNQLIFPLSTERHLGSTRSGSLMKDIAYSAAPMKTIRQVIEDAGGIPEEAKSGGILSIGSEGNTSGSIGIDDWLRAQPIHISGIGDALIELKNLGLTQRELTADQQTVLVEKINQHRGLIYDTISKERQRAAKADTAQGLTNQPFLQGEALEDLLISLKEEPLLAAYADEVRRRIPAYRKNDIALFAAVATQMADLLLATLAGQSGPLARERNRRVRDQFLDALQRALAKSKKDMDAGSIPEPIRCPHVPSLTAIRKIPDDTQRMMALSKFLANFQKTRRDNWVWCSAAAKGSEHKLLCYHEVLLLEEFKHPREKDAIHKELLLNFSGGQFQGKYICRNCGQPISDLEFDASMEFDDEGRPMGGRAVMVDQDAIAEEELDTLLTGTPNQEDPKMKFDSEQQKLVYETTREIFDKLGIYCDTESYKRILERVESELQRAPTRAQYAKRAKKEADYDAYINRMMVASVGAHVLIEIQAKTPDFLIRSTIPGCRAGFSGIPFTAGDDKTGVEYISCAIETIKKQGLPWNLTGYSRIQDTKKRRETIAANIETILGGASKTPIVQQLFIQKRAYLEKPSEKQDSLVAAKQIKEDVGEGFRPIPYYVSEEEAATAVVVTQAASLPERTRGWIQTAHRLARKHGTYVQGSPFLETSCCFTKITEPRGFWGEEGKALPPLPPKTAPRGQAASQAIARFTPRPLARLLADPPEELFYRVFLRVCYDGPRKGLPHEPGYTNECAHCGFVFPENPFIPLPRQPFNADKATEKEMLKEWRSEVEGVILKGKVALETQGVALNRDTFQGVLDESHRRYKVEIPKRKEPTMGVELLLKLGRLDPEPFKGWAVLMESLLDAVQKLPAQAQLDEFDVADAYAPLSRHYIDSLGEIQRRLGAEASQSLHTLLKGSTPEIVEAIRTHFLIPFQRLLGRFWRGVFTASVQRSYKLPAETEEDINSVMYKQYEYISKIQPMIKGYAAMKVEGARNALARVLPILQDEVRANLIPGGSAGIGYLVGSLILGILSDFLNPSVVPVGVTPPDMGDVIDTSAGVPANLMSILLIKLRNEGLSFTEESIRDAIARRNEMENKYFIKKLELPPEEKQMAMRIKKLGLKEWAAGAANIYTLNPEQYERDREQRIAMGLVDFGTDAALTAAVLEMQRNEAYGGGGDGAEGGYDNAQIGADDF
jgi:hypothetical protein